MPACHPGVIPFTIHCTPYKWYQITHISTEYKLYEVDYDLVVCYSSGMRYCTNSALGASNQLIVPLNTMMAPLYIIFDPTVHMPITFAFSHLMKCYNHLFIFHAQDNRPCHKYFTLNCLMQSSLATT